MIYTLKTSDICLWLLLVCAEIALTVCLARKRLWGRLPCFSIFSVVSACDALVLLALGTLGSYEGYYRAFYFGGKITAALAFLSLVEIARIVLPALDLPAKRAALVSSVAGFLACMAFVILWPMASREKQIELGAFMVIAAAFIFLFSYSIRLGIYWSRLTALIALGFLLRFSMQAVCVAIIGHWPDCNNSFILMVRQMSMAVHLAALGVWIYASMSRWGEHGLTLADAKIVQRLFNNTESALMRGEGA